MKTLKAHGWTGATDGVREKEVKPQQCVVDMHCPRMHARACVKALGIAASVFRTKWEKTIGENPINAVFMETASQTKAKDPDGTNQALHSTFLLKAPPSGGRAMEPNACRGWASEAQRATTSIGLTN